MTLISALLELSESAAPFTTLTRLSALLTERPWGSFTQLLIRQFIRQYGICMEEVLEQDLRRYRTFNDFFTRELRPDARPVDAQAPAVCPVDGTLAQCGSVTHGRLLQAKGLDYSLRELLGGSDADARPFEERGFATIYLSPRNYHRIHMPLDAALVRTVHVPGRHFPVGRRNISHLPRLYTRNERLVCFFDSPRGRFCLVAVAAALVGGISTAWAGTLRRSRDVGTAEFEGGGLALARGAELGRFQYGSTVICLWENPQLACAAELQPGIAVRMGQPLLRGV